MTVREAGTSPPVVVFPDELIFDAVQRMLRGGYGRLAVVDRDNPRKIVGYFGRASVMSSLLQRLQEENEREPAWTPWRRERRSTPHAAQEKQEAKE
jgi:predicted transcriptional regulator